MKLSGAWSVRSAISPTPPPGAGGGGGVLFWSEGYTYYPAGRGAIILWCSSVIPCSGLVLAISPYLHPTFSYSLLEDAVDVGGVVIGDVPSWRVDNMPYGGVKESGLGREGITFAMEDMTEIRLMVLRTPS